MVMKDAELNELWGVLGAHRGEIRNHLEAAIGEEQTASSYAERLFREYRDLKADYEHEHEALGKLQEDYQKRIAEYSELKRKYDKLNKDAVDMQRQLMQKR